MIILKKNYKLLVMYKNNLYRLMRPFKFVINSDV